MPRHLIAALTALAISLPSWAAEMEGSAVAVDGDSIRLNGAELRLYGIDAPELAQQCGNPSWPCGRAAHDALAVLLAGRDAKCRAMDADHYGRIIATCRAGGVDVAEAMVRQGLAIAYRRYSQRYIPAEEEARQAQRGIWSGPFDPPEEWRKNHPRK